VADILRVLFQVNEMLEDIDMPQINAAVMASAEAVERLVDSPAIQAALDQVPGMTAQINQTMAEVGLLAQRAGAAIDPIQLQIEGTSTEMTATLEALRRTLEETHGLLSTDSGLGYGLQETLVSLRDAADALTLLVSSLEQNPDMLLRGRSRRRNDHANDVRRSAFRRGYAAFRRFALCASLFGARALRAHRFSAVGAAPLPFRGGRRWTHPPRRASAASAEKRRSRAEKPAQRAPKSDA
jgi:hypothetical protein